MFGSDGAGWRAKVGMLLERLKSETATIHAAVEAEIGLTDPNLQRDRYVDVLKRLYGFHAGLEPRLAVAIGDEAFLAPRRRLPDLARDLAHLGADDDLTRLAVWSGGPAPGDGAGALGALYVVEGSRLGGLTVSRILEQRLGLSGGGGYSYFAGSGREVGALWRGLRERIAGMSAAVADDGVIAGAIATFEAFRSFVCRPSQGDAAWLRPQLPT
jgi:heme oxygenase